jgi:hypothetical protein
MKAGKMQLATGIRTCATEGCDASALAGRHCSNCEAQIATLNEWHRRHDGRGGTLRRAQKWLWAPEVVFVAGVVMYLGYQVAAAFLDWPGVL